MAFPTVLDETVTEDVANGTNHTVNYPATVASGQLLLALSASDGGPTFGWPAAWTELTDQASAGGIAAGSVAYRIADGSEGGGNFTVTTSASEQIKTRIFRISNWHGTTPPEAATAQSAAATAYDPPNLDPAGWGAEDTLWIVGAMIDATGTTTHSSYPTNYTNGAFLAAAGTGFPALATARRELNASSEDPAAGAISNNREKVVVTVAIRPAAGGTLFTATLTGGVTSAGAAVKRVDIRRSGAVTPVGALSRRVNDLHTGAVTPAGALIRRPAKILAGAITLAGALQPAARKALAGTIASSGALVKRVARSAAGAIAPAGALVRRPSILVTGGQTPAGALVVTKFLSRVFGGTLWDYAERVRNDGPGGYWRLGDTGALAQDEIGDHDGSIGPDVDLGLAGAIRNDADTAMRFDYGQPNGSITIGDADDAFAFEGFAPFSVEAWLYLEQTPTQYSIPILRRTGNDGWNIAIGATPYIYWERLNTGAASPYNARATPAIVPGRWYYYVATFSATRGKAYLDGALVDDVAIDTPLPANPSVPAVLGIVADNDGTGRFQMDEARIYARELSADEIREHYQMGTSVGLLGKVPALIRTGDVAPTGALIRRPATVLAGAIATAGALVKRAAVLVTGGQTPTGALLVTKFLSRVFSGTIWDYGEHIRHKDGLLAYWRLGETSGTVATDEGPNGYDGIIDSGVTLDQPGLVSHNADRAMLFDRTNGDSWVSVPEVAAWQALDDEFSLEAWVVWSGDSTSPNVVIRCGGGGNDWWLRTSTANDDMFFQLYQNVGGSATGHTISGDLTPGVVHHVVGTFQRNMAGGQRLYLDGALVAQGDTTDHPIYHGSTPVGIGSHSGGGTEIWDGTLDEIAVYDRALPATEVLETYQIGTSVGLLAKVPALTRTGDLGAAGTLVRLARKVLGGSVAPTGELSATSARLLFLEGSIATAGTLIYLVSKRLTGAVAAAGALVNQARVAFGGSTQPTGSLTASPVRLLFLEGSIATAGTLLRAVSVVKGGVVGAAGALARLATVTLSGVITAIGDLITDASQTLGRGKVGAAYRVARSVGIRITARGVGAVAGVAARLGAGVNDE